MRTKGMNKKVKEACEESDRRERVERVASILEGVSYATDKDRQEAITSFTNAKLTLEEIEMLTRPLKAEYLSAKDTYTQSQVRKVGVY